MPGGAKGGWLGFESLLNFCDREPFEAYGFVIEDGSAFKRNLINQEKMIFMADDV